MNPPSWPFSQYPVSPVPIAVASSGVAPNTWNTILPNVATVPQVACSLDSMNQNVRPALSVPPQSIQTAVVVASPNFQYAVIYPAGIPQIFPMVAPSDGSQANSTVQQVFTPTGLPLHSSSGTLFPPSGTNSVTSQSDEKKETVDRSNTASKDKCVKSLSATFFSSSSKSRESRSSRHEQKHSAAAYSHERHSSRDRHKSKKSVDDHFSRHHRDRKHSKDRKRTNDCDSIRKSNRRDRSKSSHRDEKPDKFSHHRFSSDSRRHRDHERHKRRAKSQSSETSPKKKKHSETKSPPKGSTSHQLKSPRKSDKQDNPPERRKYFCMSESLNGVSDKSVWLSKLMIKKEKTSIEDKPTTEISNVEKSSGSLKGNSSGTGSSDEKVPDSDENEKVVAKESGELKPYKSFKKENSFSRERSQSPKRDRRDHYAKSKSPSLSSRNTNNRNFERSPLKSPTERKIYSHLSKYSRENKRRLSPIENPPRNHHKDRVRLCSKSPELPSLSTKACKYIQSSPAENYYQEGKNLDEIIADEQLKSLHSKFRFELVDRAERIRATKPKFEPPKRKTKLHKLKPPKEDNDDDSSSSCCDESSSSEDEDTAMEELERKRQHPDRLHLELWFNDPKEMNDGPLCRCSAKARRAGIRHGIYVGEDHLLLCDPFSNNVDKLHHYRVTMTPVTNFLTENPTKIHHNDYDYIFEGFSLFSHSPLPKLPNCKVIRFNYEYTILYIEEKMPTNFTVQGLELFSSFLLNEVLELVDLNWKAHNDPDGCPRFHFMPRFSRELKDGGKELLAHCYVLKYLLKKNEILIDDSQLSKVLKYSNREWQKMADKVKGMIVTCPGMKPSSIRVDQLDREQCSDDETFPVIVHFGVRPPQLSYAGNPRYQKAWREYVKYRHLLANKPKVKYADRHKLLLKETRLQEMRMENDLKRDVTVVINSKNFYKTGIMSDIIQHAMLLPVLVCHLRFHQSLTYLEKKIGYQFKDRFLLQLALTHPSYRENFGTNPDHARNSLTNCGLRQPQYGDRRIHYMNTRKRGINTLINIMSRFGSQKETLSCINHNERLEFLGDAVVEFLSSIHLFYMFPDLEEGGLATYRAAIVQNQHLAVLAKKLELDRFMLYAHGSDLCHDLELRHAMANCFEALMGALFLDNGIEIADKVFSETLFSEYELLEVWKNFPPHPLQEQEPDGDRKWIVSVPLLQKLHQFEEAIGIEFNHIRLLARALTHRSLGYNNLTLGSNQRLEFLGDTVLQLVASEYLYKFFPEHHEGHLSLLRSSLVNNRTQAVVCADLGMVDYAIYPYSKVELKPKDKADLLEAFLGALYVDKDLGYCRKFCEVCFFPRLQDFIMNQDWNDPKSKLQQCCLTLRSMDGGEPDIPTYKVIECKGPTNTRVYSVAVYFQSKRLAVGTGHSIQQAEMDAAANALKKSKDLFPQLRHQRRAIERSLKHKPPKKEKHK